MNVAIFSRQEVLERLRAKSPTGTRSLAEERGRELVPSWKKPAAST